MLFPFLGYFVASTVLTAVAVLLTGLVNTATLEKGRHHPPPVIARTVKVEIQRHSPVAKEASPAKDVSPVAIEASPAKSVANEASPAKDVSPVVATAKPTKDVSRVVSTEKADNKKSKHSKPKVLARQHNNYERPGYYGNALGYAQESRNGPQRLFSW
jgi:hypothetical protein